MKHATNFSPGIRRELSYRARFRKDTGLAPCSTGGLWDRRFSDICAVMDQGMKLTRDAVLTVFKSRSVGISTFITPGSEKSWVREELQPYQERFISANFGP